ncbi:hypothetical protein, partial [Burkholderia sp. SIMBA_019]|uniref:hypothetical protein n=1 Tax=Burkholderia sp. SIMBA_019 TaxID=3085765 RepID=UPI00397D5D47
MNRRLLVVLIAALPIFAHAKGPNCADRYGIAAWGAVATRGLLGPDPDHSTATFGPSERFPHLPGPTLMAEQYLGRSSKDGAKLYRQVYFVNIYDAQGKQIAEVI